MCEKCDTHNHEGCGECCNNTNGCKCGELERTYMHVKYGIPLKYGECIKLSDNIFKYPIITIVGSTHYHMDYIDKRYAELSKNAIVFKPLDKGITRDMSEDTLVDMYKEQIYLSDKVVVENVNGYVGDHTQGDIDFAISHNIPVEYMYDIETKRLYNIQPGTLLYNKRDDFYLFVFDVSKDPAEIGVSILYCRESRPFASKEKYNLNTNHGMVIGDANILFRRIHNVRYKSGYIFDWASPENMNDWDVVQQVDDETLQAFIDANKEFHKNSEIEI